jgi:hypothetical protein
MTSRFSIVATVTSAGRLRVLWGTLMLALAIAFTPAATAQSFYGSIQGAALDTSGAVVPGVDVTITNLGTGDHQAAKTDNNGNYRFLNLIPGQYSLTFQKTGFQKFERANFTLDVQAALRIDAAMQVGQVTQTVEITSATPLLDTEDASVSQVIEAAVVQDTPINGRNVDNLIALTAGVIPQNGTVMATTNNGNGGSGTGEANASNYSIGGGASNQNAIVLNGVTINRPDGDSAALVPTQDAVQEFRVDTNNLPPDSGRTAGGAIIESTKSGSNAFHGGLYDYFRNTVLNANAFFNNQTTPRTKRGEFNQNQYGAFLGGPIKKDKIFFYLAEEITDNRVAAPSTFSVPTQAELRGDFSQAGLPKIYDPLTVCGFYGNAPCATPGTYTRQQFAGNIIPTNRIDPAAVALSNFWLPCTGALSNGTCPANSSNANGLTSNYTVNQHIENNQSQENARMDYTISDKQSAFAQFTLWHTSVTAGDPFGKGLVGQPFAWQTTNIAVGDTYVFSPSTVASVRIGYLRNINNSKSTEVNAPFAKVSQFGPGWAAEQSLFQNQTYPGLSFPSSVPYGFVNAGYTRDAGDTYSISGDLTKIIGKHSFKFGGEARLLEWFQWGEGLVGNLTFDTTFDSVNPASQAGTGYGLAAFLLGFPTTGSTNHSLNASQYQHYNAIFAQDSYKVSNKLQVVYGARWDVSPGEWQEKHGYISVFNPTETDPLGAKVGLPLVGQVDFAGSTQDPTTSIHPSHRDLISPRLGITYRLSPNTVLRSGYSILFVPSNVSTTDSPASTSATVGTASMVTTLNGGVTPAAAYVGPFGGSTYPSVTTYATVGTAQTEGPLSLPYPNGIVQAAGRSATAMTTAIEGASITDPLVNFQYPTEQQWNLSIENQSVKGILVAAAYVGSKGTHLIWTGSPQLDQLADQYDVCGTASTASQCGGHTLTYSDPNNPFYQVLPNSAGKFATAPTIAWGQLLRPFPQFQGVVNPALYEGDTTYHSLQIRAEKRFGSTGVLGGTYSWLKMIDNYDSAPQDWTNLAAEKSLSAFDAPNRATIRYVYTLPFGKGSKHLNSLNGWENGFVSGWALDGVSTFQGGFPLAFSVAGFQLSNYGAGTGRPNLTCPVTKTTGRAASRIGAWFNTSSSCIAAPANGYTYGNAPRQYGGVRAQGVDNYDLALAKKTNLAEGVKLEMRFEAFNLMNHPQFTAPGVQCCSTPSAGGNFGQITSTVSSQLNFPRLVQLAARLTF